jgi:putative transposase
MPLKRQAELLGLSRSSVYYMRQPASDQDLMLMRRLDELHWQLSFYGSSQLANERHKKGQDVGRRDVVTLVRRVGIAALYRRPRTSNPVREATVHPYLLSGLAIERSNQVGASDITYLPTAHRFMYLAAIVHVASRKVLAFRLFNTKTADFCIKALNAAIARFSMPEIFNTDQGSQFMSDGCIKVLKDAASAISADGKSRWIDNVSIERLWRRVNYEEVQLQAYANGTKTQMPLARHFNSCNGRRSHQALRYSTLRKYSSMRLQPRSRSRPDDSS